MTGLPEQFAKRMKNMLGTQYEGFKASYDSKRNNGLRINPLKITPPEFTGSAPFDTEPVPWVGGGFFYSHEQRASSSPYYNAGLYYLQEPSAMTPADRLPVEKGDRVLDLCAAPGGKAFALAGKLAGTGLLAANEINPSRAKALLQNLERCGAANAVIFNETPEALAKEFPLYFNKIIVDAPCSGEGMFRKSAEAVKMWSEERVREMAAVQKAILKEAYAMLAPGGLLMYSTCTFSPEENERNIKWFIKEFPDMSMCDIRPYEGFDHGHPEWAGGFEEVKKAVRIWPHMMEGEGHFLALMKKAGSGDEAPRDKETRIRRKKADGKGMSAEEKRELAGFLKNCVYPPDEEKIEVINGKAYLPALPEELLSGLKVIRNGLFIGEFKKGRFSPSQAFAMTLSSSSYRFCLNLEENDPRALKYLKGETLLIPEGMNFPGKAPVLVCAGGFSLGFSRASGNILKNKLLYHWRV